MKGAEETVKYNLLTLLFNEKLTLPKHPIISNYDSENVTSSLYLCFLL